MNADVVEQNRSALFGLAYRMLGTVMDAEDIVQEAFLRWQNAPESDIRSPRAYLMTIVTRLCLDHLRLARVQREDYIGEWLPEPLLQSSEGNPEQMMELDESLSMAFLALLEKLSPLERAVFLLHDVFDYTFADIAPIVERTPADCRQVGRRARQRLAQSRPRFEVDRKTVEEIVNEFLRACAGDDKAELLALLDTDVTATVDGGGKVKQAALNMLSGRERVSALSMGVFHAGERPFTYQLATVNGQPALVCCSEGQVFGVANFDVRERKIHAVYLVVNPDKLKNVRGFCGEEM